MIFAQIADEEGKGDIKITYEVVGTRAKRAREFIYVCSPETILGSSAKEAYVTLYIGGIFINFYQ